MKEFAAITGVIVITFFFGALVFYGRIRKVQRLGTTSPVGDQMLRPPGFSLRERISALEDSLPANWYAGAILPPLVGFGAFVCASKIHMREWTTFWVVFGICLVVTVAGWVLAFRYCSRKLNEWLDCQLGLRGEELVAQQLNPLYRKGYRIFHDFPIEGRKDKANIDHVVIGPNGAFVIETKMRRKHKKLETGREFQKVEYTGSELIYPNFRDKHGLGQTEANVKHLSEFIFQTTGRRIPVTGILVLPGWYVTTTGRRSVLVRNHKAVVKTILSWKASISKDTFRDAVVAVRKHCCDVMV